MARRQLETLQTIDWYDGIVLAVVSTNWMEGVYLASLLAFDPEKKERVFALLPLEQADLSEIRARVGGDWELLLSYLKQLWNQASGSITLLYFRDAGERIVAESTMDSADLKDDAISAIEEAVNSSRLKWFQVFGATAQ